MIFSQFQFFQISFAPQRNEMIPSYLSASYINKTNKTKAKTLAQTMFTTPIYKKKENKVQWQNKPVDVEQLSKIVNSSLSSLNTTQTKYVAKQQMKNTKFVQQILDILHSEEQDTNGDIQYIIPLYTELKSINYTLLHEYLASYFQKLIQLYLQDNQDNTQIGYQHVLVFSNALSRFIVDMKKVTTFTFNFDNIDKIKEIRINKQKLQEILLHEQHYLHLSIYTTDKQQKAPQVKQNKVITEDQINRTVNRLYNDAIINQQRKRKQQQENYLNQTANMTFKPTIYTDTTYIESNRKGMYGQDEFIQKRRNDIQKDKEMIINAFLAEIINTADQLNLKISDQLLAEVKYDLENAGSKAVQEDIVNRVKDQMFAKFNLLEKITYMKKQEQKELNEQSQQDSLIISGMSERERQAQSQFNREKFFREKQQKQEEKFQEIERKRQESIKRSEIIQKCKTAGIIDAKKVQQMYGDEGMKLIFGNNTDTINNTLKQSDAEILFKND